LPGSVATEINGIEFILYKSSLFTSKRPFSKAVSVHFPSYGEGGKVI
jgi:hypothetical protein